MQHAFDRIHFLVPKGFKGKYETHARDAYQTNITNWLRRLMAEDYAKHNPPSSHLQ